MFPLASKAIIPPWKKVFQLRAPSASSFAMKPWLPTENG
jgi:hypothetical protein